MSHHSQTHYAVEDSIHLVCDALSLGGQFPTLRRIVMLIRNAGNCSPIKTQRNDPEQLQILSNVAAKISNVAHHSSQLSNSDEVKIKFTLEQATKPRGGVKV